VLGAGRGGPSPDRNPRTAPTPTFFLDYSRCQALTLQRWSRRPATLVTFDTNMSFTARQTSSPAIKLPETDLHEDFRPKPQGKPE
jgi:hypothetical protein